MLAFENQYILADNVGNEHTEHFIMIEFIKHFSWFFMWQLDESQLPAPHAGPIPPILGFFLFFLFFFSLPSCLLLLWEYTNGFDYIIAANFMSPTSIVTHHKQEWISDSIQTKVELDLWWGELSHWSCELEGKDHRKKNCTMHDERLSLDYQPLHQAT